MEELIVFLSIYGWQLALIALAGIVILGVLKYLNVFSNVAKEKRKPLYFLISVGFSLLAAVIYLAVIGQFEVDYMVAVATAIYALNQTFYAIYETTTARELLAKVFAILSEKIQKQHNKTNQ